MTTRIMIILLSVMWAVLGCGPSIYNFPSTQYATQDAICATLRALNDLNALPETQTVVLTLQMQWASETDVGVTTPITASEEITGQSTSSMTTTLAAGSGATFDAVLAKCPAATTTSKAVVRFDKKEHRAIATMQQK